MTPTPDARPAEAGPAEAEPRRPRAHWRGPGFSRILERFGRGDEPWAGLLLLSVLVGLLSGVSAVGLRRGVHLLFHELEAQRHGPIAVLLPGVGALLALIIVRFLFRERAGHGVPQVIRAVCRGGGKMPRRGIFSLWLGSLVNVSSGGSAGLESPIVYSGAAIGSSIGSLFGLDERRRSVLLACGVAGGISAIFNAPMTGMIFALEVVLVDWNALTVVPVIVSAVAATEVSRLILGNEKSFLDASFSMGVRDLAVCVGLGLVAGLASVALSRTADGFARLARRVGSRPFGAALVFGLAVGAIGTVAPAAIGEGYGTVVDAIGPHGLESGLLLCAGLTVAKLVTSGLTLGSGAPGGVFAPCLVVGALLGATFYRFATHILPADFVLGPEGSYALVGMAGLVAGVMQAPLTGVLLVMEVTGGYEVILPLMIVSVLSLLFARRFDPYGIYTKELASAGDLLRLGTDRRILSEIDLKEVLDRDTPTITTNMTLADVITVVRSSGRMLLPVVQPGSHELCGVLDVHTARELMFDPDLARVTLVGTVMNPDPPAVSIESSLSEAVAIFDRSGMTVLPVLEGDAFAGLLSKAMLFDRYRRELSVQVH